jgi:hypothetical protein
MRLRRSSPTSMTEKGYCLEQGSSDGPRNTMNGSERVTLKLLRKSYRRIK